VTPAPRLVLALALLAGAPAGTAGAPAAASSAPAAAPHGVATLSVWDSGAWRAWWRSDRDPGHWSASDSTLAHALSWTTLAPGLEWASVRLACAGPAWRTRLIVARLDPRRLALTLAMDLDRNQRPAWSIDRAPPEAILAVNAGQFVSLPWGWVAIDGRQRLGPGFGPTSSIVAIAGDGHVRWVHGDTLADARGVVAGFQSYSTLLAGNGVVPAPLRTAGRGVNLTHRDARLALGETRDGRLILAMTRFDALGEAAASVPIGPTTPEMAAIMGALGACDAVMLDGGISAQLLMRDASGRALRWHGMRKVPLALIARERAARAPSPGQ